MALINKRRSSPLTRNGDPRCSASRIKLHHFQVAGAPHVVKSSLRMPSPRLNAISCARAAPYVYKAKCDYLSASHHHNCRPHTNPHHGQITAGTASRPLRASRCCSAFSSWRLHMSYVQHGSPLSLLWVRWLSAFTPSRPPKQTPLLRDRCFVSCSDQHAHRKEANASPLLATGKIPSGTRFSSVRFSDSV